MMVNAIANYLPTNAQSVLELLSRSQFSAAFIAEHVVRDIPSVSLGQLAVSPPSSCCTRSLFTDRTEQRAEKSLA